jgi:hypothetical protein
MWRNDAALIDGYTERSGFPATVVAAVGTIIDPTTEQG